ncbi:MAG: XrtA/PEP-CTERM system exopolysaccharide export protein [Gammaproteobacteria bacterium]
MVSSTRSVIRGRWAVALCIGVLAVLSGCNTLPAPREDAAAANADFNYLIGAGDTLNIFVWRNQDLSSSGVPVRPDGKITIPLVEDLPAAGRTPTELARDIEKALGQFVRDPQVSVTVHGFVGEPYEQVRVVGAAAKPSALPYRKNMTVLDVLVSVGGLTDYAAGNRASIVRTEGGTQAQYRVRLDDLIRGGDISANVPVRPGDIIVIPEAWF